MIILEMSLNLTVWRRRLKTVNVFGISKRDAVLADDWGTTALLLLVLIVSLVLIMLLLLKHVIYLAHVVLVDLSIISVATRHNLLFLVEFDTIDVELLGV